MPARQIQVTDSLETFRTEFNALAASDFGDIGTLDPALSATSVIGAINEINSIVTSAAGWFIEDATSTQQAIGSGQTLRAYGISNQTTAIVSSPDTLTIGLAPDVTISNDLAVAGSITNVGGGITAAGNLSVQNVTGTGTSHLLGTIRISGNTISSENTDKVTIDDDVDVNGVLTAGYIEMNPSTGYAAGGGFRSTRAEGWILFDGIPVIKGRNIALEGNNENDFEAVLRVAEPTSDVVIDFPDISGVVILDNSSGYATSAIFTASESLTIYNSAGVLQKTIVGSAT